MYGVASTATVGASQNGWPASASPSTIGIVTVSVALRNGPKSVSVARKAANPLIAFIQWWDANVEPVTTLGGYNYREIRGYEGSGTISNHGSGTAVDINASAHPLSAYGTVPAPLRAAISAKAASLGLKWGGDYRNRKDEMHIEVASPMDRVVQVAEQAVVNYWWVGLIVAGSVTGAVLYRHRFGALKLPRAA